MNSYVYVCSHSQQYLYAQGITYIRIQDLKLLLLVGYVQYFAYTYTGYVCIINKIVLLLGKYLHAIFIIGLT